MINRLLISIGCLAMAMMGLTSCGESESKKAQTDSLTEAADTRVNCDKAIAERKVYFDGKIDKNKAFIVISKKNRTLTVYAPVDGDTIIVARYPVCLSRNKGNKEGSGDYRTPECSMAEPFHISQIQDASDWCHDFGDGRGSIKAYGKWFLRLATPHKGIGIHGSTNNEESVPGRESEGCIRLRDDDIIHLHDNYAAEDMKVVIKHEEEGPYPFEYDIKNYK